MAETEMKVFDEPGSPECFGAMQNNYGKMCSIVCTFAKKCAYLTLKYREFKGEK